MAAERLPGNGRPDTSDDESTDALPLIEVLVRRHEEITSTGAGVPDLPGPSGAFTTQNSLNSHFFEHCGMALRSGAGALLSSLWHLWIPGDYTFLTAVVASVCLAPTVGATLAKSMHSIYVVLLLPPLTLAALLLGSPAPINAFGYTASVALACLSFLVVMASPPPTTRKLSIALSVVGVFRSCQLVLESPLNPDATTAFAATDWAAVLLLVSRVMTATLAGVGAQAVAVLPFLRLARTQMDAELKAAAAGVALHAEAVAAAMAGEVDPLSDEWGIETRGWREAVAEALASAAEHGAAAWAEGFLRYYWDAAERQRQLKAIQTMARLLCKLGDAQLELRAATDRDRQRGAAHRDQRGAADREHRKGTADKDHRRASLDDRGRQRGTATNGEGQKGALDHDHHRGSTDMDRQRGDRRRDGQREINHARDHSAAGGSGGRRSSQSRGSACHGRVWHGAGAGEEECGDECTGMQVLQAMAPELRALCACARAFAQRAGDASGGGAGGARLASDIDEVMDRLDASFLEARMEQIYLPRYKTACELERLGYDGISGEPRSSGGGDPPPGGHPTSGSHLTATSGQPTQGDLSPPVSGAPPPVSYASPPVPSAPPSASGASPLASRGSASLALFSGTAHQALIIAEGMIFLWTRFGKTMRDAARPPANQPQARHGCGACPGRANLSCGCGRLASAGKALRRALVGSPKLAASPCLPVAGSVDREEWDVAMNVEAARLGCATLDRDRGRCGEGVVRNGGEGGTRSGREGRTNSGGEGRAVGGGDGRAKSGGESRSRRVGEERPTLAPAGGSSQRKKIKGAARLSVALLAACLLVWPETRGLWAGITVAMVMELGPGASFRASMYRLQGSVIGAFYAVAAIYAASKLDTAVYGTPTTTDEPVPPTDNSTLPVADVDADPPWANGRDVLRLGVLLFLFFAFASVCGFVRASVPKAAYAALVSHFTAAIVLMGPRCGGLGPRCADTELGAQDFSFDRIQYTLVGLAIVTLASLIVFPVDSRGTARHALADGAAGLRLLWAQSHEHWLSLSHAPGGKPGREPTGKPDCKPGREPVDKTENGMPHAHSGVELVAPARTIIGAPTRTAAPPDDDAPTNGAATAPAGRPVFDPATRLQRALSHACDEARPTRRGRGATDTPAPPTRRAGTIAPHVSALSDVITRRLAALPPLIEEAEATPACWRPPYAGHPANAVLRAMQGLLDALGTLQLSNEAIGPGEALALLRPMQRPLDRLELMVAHGMRRLEQKLRLSGARAVRGIGDASGGPAARRREPLYASVQSTLQLLDDCYGVVITSLAERAFRERAHAERQSLLAVDDRASAGAWAAAALAAAAPPTPNRDILCFNARVYAVRQLAHRMLQLDSAIDEMHVHEEPFDLRSVVFA